MELTLTNEMIWVLVLLGVTLALFVSEIVRIDIAALLVLVVVGLAELVPTDQLFVGLSSNAVVSIIAVMILGAGLDRTGVMGSVASAIMKIGGKTEGRMSATVSSTVGLVSGFMQNVGATALFLPVVSKVSNRSGLALSRLLMPMGFCAIMGGTLTMIGSSPLILLNDLLKASNNLLPPGVDTMRSFSLFSVTPVGLMLLFSAVILFAVFGRWILPRKPGESGESAQKGNTKQYFASVYGIEGDIFELVVNADSDLVGYTVSEVEALEMAPFLLGTRNGDDTHLSPPGDEMIWVGTVLAVMGPRKSVREWSKDFELTMRVRLRDFQTLVNSSRAGIAEAVVVPGSNMIGKTLADIQPRRKFGINPLAINRGDEIIREEMRETPLAVGDTLVFFGKWREFSEVTRSRDLVLVTDIPQEEQRPHKVAHALFFFALAFALILFTGVKLSLALLTGAMGMVVSGVINMDEAYRAVSWKTVFLLASLIPLGIAMETTGTAAWVAQEVIVMIGDYPEWVIQSALALLATFFSLVMSNVGATVLLVPLAINIALAINADPALFALTIALATSNAFLIPTHQVSALIMGPGGYSAIDFIRVGGLTTLMFLVVLIPSLRMLF